MSYTILLQVKFNSKQEDMMTSRHSAAPRGLNATRSSLSQGRFGRMFRNLPPAHFGPTEADNIANLSALADAMTAGFDKPFDGPDPEESGIPSLYTYFGQFVDHDITFDPVSVLTKAQDPDGLVDFRTPALDLDNVYGRGPGDQPYIYDDLKFRQGVPLKGQGVADATDLPRFAGRALIGDPRNDENSIVSYRSCRDFFSDFIIGWSMTIPDLASRRYSSVSGFITSTSF
jgi:hypothetical protein